MKAANKMRITILLLLATCCWSVRSHQEPELMRLSRRPSRSEGVGDYKTGVIHSDNNANRKHSISTVTVQLSLKDNKQVTTEADDDGYVTAPGIQELQIKPAQIRRHLKKHDNDLDSETGASNSHSAARYMLPPEGFLNHLKQQNQGRYVQETSTPAPVINQDQHQQYHQHQQQQQQHQQQQQQQQQHQQQQQQHQQHQHQIQQQQQQQHNQEQQQQQQLIQQQQQQQQQQQKSPEPQYNAAASHVHFVTTAAPAHFTSTSIPRAQYFSSPSNYPASQVQYASAPGPIAHFNVNPDSQYASNNQQNNVRYVPSPQRVQYVSTPSPVVQFAQHDQQQQQHVQYVSTPAPNNVQYASTPPSHEHYVSSPVHFVSTPSPVQYSTSAPSFGNRINQISNEKQMHIDHFDNAMSGVRSPKFPQQGQTIFTSTPAPMVISTTITPLNPQKSNEEQWRSNVNSNAYMTNVQLQPESHQQQYQNNNFQDQSLNLNAVESANNYVVNVIHPNPQVRHRFQSNKVNQRDLEKETDVPTSYSNGDYGWKLTPKKQISSEQQSIVYQGFSNTNTPQTLALQSGPNEYRPYPENPFLNHISYPSPAPPSKTGQIQSINFQPDANELQNINVGYSIGFGNNINNQEVLKAESSVYANKYPFVNNMQGYTTAYPNVVKGVHVSQINHPDQTYYMKDPSNTQDYVTSALKVNEKYKQDMVANQAYAYNNIPASPYKISHTIKSIDGINNHNHIFAAAPKAISFQASAPNVVSSYHGSEVRNDAKNQAFKWTSIAPGVEITGGPSKPLIIDVPESATPNPVVYFNNPNDVVTNNPYYFTSHKDASGRIVQTFDHANALKNIQPIDISNVVSYSPTPPPDRNNPATVSPHYIQSVPAQMNHPVPQGHYIQHYPQDQSHISTGSMNNQNFIEQGNVMHYKPIDQSFYKDKNIIYNIQKMNPYDGNNGYNEIRIYNKPREQQQHPFESSIPSNYVLTQSNDMIGHSSNVDNRHVSNNMVYVPSDVFRNQNHDSQSDQTSSVRVTHIQPDGTSNYQHVIQHSAPEDQQGQYTNGRMNQNVESHNIEPIPSNSDNTYRLVSNLEPMTSNSDNNYRVIPNNNQRHNGQDVTYNEIDQNTASKLTTINGIQVANPYNVDLKLVSDLLRGKAAVDETRLEPMREQMSRLPPIKLDTSALQDVVAKNEQIQMDLPEQEPQVPIKNREFIEIDANRLNLDKLRSLYKQKNYNIYSDTARPFQSKYEKKEHNIPNIASEQLHSSIQSVLNAHQIGAVMEPAFKSRNPESDYPISFDEFNDSTYGREQQRFSNINSLATDDVIMRKHPQLEVVEPYPLLKPPKPPVVRGNSHKKNEKRPLIGARHNRLLMHRHSRPSKVIQDAEEFEDYAPAFRIRTELRPPPVNHKNKTG